MNQFRIVGLILLFLCLNSCAFQTDEEGDGEAPTLGQLIETSEFTINLPESWSARLPREQDAALPDLTTFIHAKSPREDADDPFLESIGVTASPLSKERTAKEIVAYYKEHIKFQFKPVGPFKKFKLVGDGEVENSKIPIFWWATTLESFDPGEIDVTKIDYIFVHGNKAFTMHSMVETKKWRKTKKTFEAIVKSIVFGNPT